MKSQSLTWALFALALIVTRAESQPPRLGVPQAISFLEQPKALEKVKDKDKEKKPGKEKKPDNEKKPVEPVPPDVFTQAALMGPQFATGFNPHMMGDFSGTLVRQTFTYFGVQTITTTQVIRDPETGTVTSTTTKTTTTPVTQTRTIVVPAGGTVGSIKIADNSSPRPVDRVYFTYNYFNNLGAFANPPVAPTGSAQNSQASTGLIDTSVNNSTVFPGLPRGGFNLHREVFGIEKTFLDGNASIELRLPLLQQSSAIDGFSSRDIGDLTIVTKYAFLLDRETGNVFSVGLAVTAPTGPSISTIDGTLHSTWLQPWFGYIWNGDRLFVQAFHSVVVPTDNRDVTLFFNDVGLSFWLYRADAERALRFIAPMVEAHVTTPLNHRDPNGDVFCPDLVVLTGGVHFGLFNNGTVTLGVATPVTGPRVYNVEAFVQLNWRY